MESPGMAFIGVTALGMGSLIGYAAYKNVPVFGASGLLTQAITTGKFTAVTPATNAATSSQNAATTTSAIAAGASAASTVASGGAGASSEAQAALQGPFGVIEYNAQRIAQILLGKLKI